MTQNIATSTNVHSWPLEAEPSPVVWKSQYFSLAKGVSISPTALFSVTDLFQIRTYTKRLYVESTCRFSPGTWEVNLTSLMLQRVVWLSCLMWSTCAQYETHKMMIRRKCRFCVPRQYSKVDLEMLTRVSTLLFTVRLEVAATLSVIHSKLLQE
jgi:hypothetical protein